MRFANLLKCLLVLFVSVLSTNCGGDPMEGPKYSFHSLNAVTEYQWQRLAEKRIYFGHQSVGFNIVDGMKDVMKENPRVKLVITETNEPSALRQPGFAHSRVGQNTDPLSKIADFDLCLKEGLGNNVDFALLKFCYGDVDARTDVHKLFSAYKQSIEGLKREYPGITIIHSTLPITKSQASFKTKIKTLIGKKDLWEYNDNIKRNEYNDLLLMEYYGKDPVFDLAAVESAYPDGARSSFRVAGRTYYSLVPDYTTDGGHLNDLGKKLVAQELIIFLALLEK